MRTCTARSADYVSACSQCACAAQGYNRGGRIQELAAMALAFVFPGQGSQSLGMLAELAEREPVVRRVFDNASSVLDYDLWDLVQNGPEEDLNKTERTQPAMLAAGFAVWRVWREHGGAVPTVMSGHSLGEYTALVCSRALDFTTAIS